MQRLAPAIVLLLLTPASVALVGVPDAPVEPITQPDCGSVTSGAIETDEGVLENLHVERRGIFVTGDGQLRRYAWQGGIAATLEGPDGGLAMGPDGWLYAGVGNSATGSVSLSGAAAVWRVHPDTFEWEVYAEGFDMANGLVFDGAGNLYVSNDFGHYIVRIPPGGGSWELWAEVYSANGMAVRNGELYAALTFDQRSPIVAIRLDDPSQQRIVAETSLGALTLEPAVHAPSDAGAPLVPKGLDDMAFGNDGSLYVAANAAGEILRVKPATGETCVLVPGVRMVSSVRLYAEGSTARTQVFIATTFTGRLYGIFFSQPNA